jgi:hypothetical protein
VPEEFAAAYRAAYERALAAQGSGPRHRSDDEPVAGDDTDAPDETDESRLPARRGRLRVGTHRSTEDEDSGADSPTRFERLSHSTWFVPLLLAVLALLLILGAYAVGRMFAGQVSTDETPDEEPTLATGEAGRRYPVTHQDPAADAWDGKVSSIDDIRAEVGCTSDPGVDGSGASVDYGAENLTDGAADTTWRCDGRAVGERITLDLSATLPIGEVGLIPGYAKTDELTKADRYAENNRVTRVRWSIGDTEVVQEMRGTPKDRSLRAVRVPRTSADTVALEILAVKQGPRNTTAISEVHLGRAD